MTRTNPTAKTTKREGRGYTKDFFGNEHRIFSIFTKVTFQTLILCISNDFYKNLYIFVRDYIYFFVPKHASDLFYLFFYEENEKSPPHPKKDAWPVFQFSFVFSQLSKKAGKKEHTFSIGFAY